MIYGMVVIIVVKFYSFSDLCYLVEVVIGIVIMVGSVVLIDMIVM